MKEVKVRRVSEGLFELETPTWCWSPHPYIAEGLRRIVAGGDLPIYVYKKFTFTRDVYVVVTTRVGALKV